MKHTLQEGLLNSNHLTKIALQRYSFDSNETSDHFKTNNKQFLETIVDIFVYTNYFPKEELQKFSIQLILDYLVKTHQNYIKKSLPELEQTIYILKQEYDQTTYPCLLLLELFFKDYKKHLVEHITYEENTFFPYINYLINTQTKNVLQKDCKIGSYKMTDFCKKHTDTELSLKNVRKAISNYEPSSTNTSLYRILLTQLKIFEMDLHLHAQIEEDILLPKAIELENKIKTYNRNIKKLTLKK